MEGMDASGVGCGCLVHGRLCGVFRCVERRRCRKRTRNAYRADFREATLDEDQALSQLKSSTTSADWHTIAEAKGVLFWMLYGKSMGDDAFYAVCASSMKKTPGRRFMRRISSHPGSCAAGTRSEMAEWDRVCRMRREGPVYMASAIRPRSARRFWCTERSRKPGQSVRGGAVAEITAESIRKRGKDLQGFRSYRRGSARS